MIRRTFMLFAGMCFAMTCALGQEGASFRGFDHFKGIVPGIDFFASSRQEVEALGKPLNDAREKLAGLLGADLPKGAIFICSTLKQKDSVYEPRALKMGYGWILVALTAEARMEEMLARVRSQIGGELPAEMLQRIQSRSGDARAAAESAMARTTVRQMGYAIPQALFAPDKAFRISRIEDVRRSPLPDWLDVGIASYAAGSAESLGYLQQHLDEAFPLEDVILMSRPFVASSEGEFGGGGLTLRMGGPAGAATPEGAFPGAAPPGAAPGFAIPGMAQGMGRGPRQIPKDQQDRMLFDGAASAFFRYLMEKIGSEKVRQLIRESSKTEDSRTFLAREDVLGTDFYRAEQEWLNWLKEQKADEPEEFRSRARPERF